MASQIRRRFLPALFGNGPIRSGRGARHGRPDSSAMAGLYLGFPEGAFAKDSPRHCKEGPGRHAVSTLRGGDLRLLPPGHDVSLRAFLESIEKTVLVATQAYVKRL